MCREAQCTVRHHACYLLPAEQTIESHPARVCGVEWANPLSPTRTIGGCVHPHLTTHGQQTKICTCAIASSNGLESEIPKHRGEGESDSGRDGSISVLCFGSWGYTMDAAWDSAVTPFAVLRCDNNKGGVCQSATVDIIVTSFLVCVTLIPAYLPTMRSLRLVSSFLFFSDAVR